MKCKPLVAILLLAGSSAALANQKIAPVQVMGEPEFAIQFDCANPVAPSPADVERILQVQDNRQTNGLSHRLMTAVAEACNAGVATIEVQRGIQGQSLTWTPIRRNVNQGVAAN
jgi:hypothetical protein